MSLTVNPDLGGCGSGHRHLVWEPGKGVGMDNFVGAPCHTGVATVALQVRANIPAVNAGGRPGAALAGFLVDDNVGAKRGKRVFVVVVGAMKLGPGREVGVEPRGAQEVQSEDSLWKQQAPIVERELGVTATKTGNEVVLESLDGSLGSIPAVDVGRGELVGNVFRLEVGFEDCGALVVQGLKAWATAGADECVVEFGIAGLDDFGFATGKGLNSNVVAVIVVEKEQVVVAFAGGEREAASEISIAATGGRAIKHSSKKEVGALALIKSWGKEIKLRKKGKGEMFRFGGLDILADLFDVGFGSGNGIRGVFAERS